MTFSLISCKGVSTKNHVHNNQDKDIELIPLTDQYAIFPSPIGVVSDYSNVFSQEEEDELLKILFDSKALTEKQVVIVTIDTISPYDDIQEYATELGNRWGVGSLNENNGLVVVLSKSLRKVGIATGLKTELTLTDSICLGTIEKIMIPEFQNGNYYQGIKFGLEDLLSKW